MTQPKKEHVDHLGQRLLFVDGSQADEGDVQLLLEGLESLGYSLVGAREVREMAGKPRPSHGGFNLPKMVW